jgi:voltage-gated potassium channel
VERPVNPATRLRMALGFLLLFTGIGTAGFIWLEGLSPFEALYLTIVTLATIGYGDIVPLTQAGRLFAIILVVGGGGTALYLVAAVVQLMVEGELRELWGRSAMERRMEQLSGHVVMCGYGRFGRVVAAQLLERGEKLVVIDSDPSREAELRALGAPYVIGSGTVDDVLEHAGVRRAQALVIATPSDADNVFITLSAREKNPALQIFARGESDGGLRRLELAGATLALSAYQAGALRMAASVLRASVVDFLELSARGEDVAIEEVRVGAASGLAGTAIVALERTNPRTRIVGLKRGDEPLRMVPEPDEQVAPGDLLVVIGPRASLERLAQAAG